jgi:hypothetical protein
MNQEDAAAQKMLRFAAVAESHEVDYQRRFLQAVKAIAIRRCGSTSHPTTSPTAVGGTAVGCD